MQTSFLLPRSRMSSVYTSWERATTSTVVFESASKGRTLHEGQNMPNVSAFSFDVESHPESESCVLDSRDADTLSRENLSSSPSCSSLSGSPQTGYITSPHHPEMMLVPSEEAYGQQKLGKANGHITTSLHSLAGCNMDHSRLLRSENSASSGSMNHYQHLAVDFLPEDRPWQSSPVDSEVVDSECISSCSSLSEASVCTSSAGSEAILEESEALSSYKGPLDCMDSLEAALPLSRKSLSRFFFGHSRSFSCLADVISVKDLAKPENPYARKRRSFASLNSGMERPRLFSTRNGAGIKKPPHNNKSTLALAVAMSTKEAMLEGNLLEFQASAKLQKDSCTRSFSFSNFGSTGCQLSPDSSN